MKNALILIISMVCNNQVYSQCGGFTMNVTSANPTCYNYSDGSVSVLTTGGNGGEIYEITDEFGTAVNVISGANNLPGGWYYFEVEDDSACVLLDSVYLENPDEILVDMTITDTSLCFTDSIGNVEIDTVYGSQGTYNDIAYFWSPNPNGLNGVGENVLTNAPGGDYTLTVNDGLGCSNSFDFTIGPAELVFSVIGFDPCIEGANGGVYAAAAGGNRIILTNGLILLI